MSSLLPQLRRSETPGPCDPKTRRGGLRLRGQSAPSPPALAGPESLHAGTAALRVRVREASACGGCALRVGLLAASVGPAPIAPVAPRGGVPTAACPAALPGLCSPPTFLITPGEDRTQLSCLERSRRVCHPGCGGGRERGGDSASGEWTFAWGSLSRHSRLGQMLPINLSCGHLSGQRIGSSPKETLDRV